MTTTGDLKHRITFMKSTPTTDENGFSTSELQDYVTVWAASQEVSRGKEFESSGAVQVENLVDWTIRYRTDITSDMQIKFFSHVYHIIEFADVKGQHKWLWIRAREVLPGA